MVKDGILDIPLWEKWRNQKVCIDEFKRIGEKKEGEEKKKREIPKFLGASRAGAICGLCGASKVPYRAYSTPAKEWMILSGRIPTETYNENMQRGHRQEPLIDRQFQIEMGIETYVTGGWEGGSWKGVSPDRLIKENGTVTSLVEIKSSDEVGYKTEWICQIMYQMNVVRVKYGYLCICNLEKERIFQVYKVQYSEKWWEWMRVRLDYFYQCLLDDTEPRLLRYIKGEFLRATKNTKCELGWTFPPLKSLKVETIMNKKLPTYV